MEWLFIALMAVTLGILTPLTVLTYQTVQTAIAKKPDSYHWPAMSDFSLMFISAGISFAIKKLYHAILFPIYLRICREQADLEIRRVRSAKGVRNFFKVTFYLYSSLFGYLMLKDSHVLPPSLGGSGAFGEYMRNYPYWEHPPYYTAFYMNCMGFFFFELVWHVACEDWNKGDFLEMLLHHFVTIYLMLFSFLGNLFIGAPVLLIHNSSDICISLCRAINETKYNKIGGHIFIVGVAIWVYMRCWVFPQLVYTVIFQMDYQGLVP